jgi:hypothetical protein
MVNFYAFEIKAGGDIDYVRGFPTEAEADAFGIEWTAYEPLMPEDLPDFYEKYDPPIVLVVEVEKSDALESGKYTRPVAVFQRGEKWVCVRQQAYSQIVMK